MPACARPGTYVPRQTHECDAAVLVRRHLPGSLARLEENGQGPLPELVTAELEGFGGAAAADAGGPVADPAAAGGTQRVCAAQRRQPSRRYRQGPPGDHGGLVIGSTSPKVCEGWTLGRQHSQNYHHTTR